MQKFLNKKCKIQKNRVLNDGSEFLFVFFADAF
jgi:hypothetical protein